MKNLFTRLILGAALGLMIALPMTRLPFARAEEVDIDYILPDSFKTTTGLGGADLKDTIGNLINVALGFLGVVAVCIMLYGGFKWMIAGGNDEKVSEAKRLIIAGIIGLVIILSSYAITTFVIDSILTATSESTAGNL